VVIPCGLLWNSAHIRSVFRTLMNSWSVYGSSPERSGSARYWHCYWSLATVVVADSVCQCKRRTLWTQLVNKHFTRQFLQLSNKMLWWMSSNCAVFMLFSVLPGIEHSYGEVIDFVTPLESIHSYFHWYKKSKNRVARFKPMTLGVTSVFHSGPRTMNRIQFGVSVVQNATAGNNV